MEFFRQTVIKFPALNLTFTEGIAAGSLNLNELLADKNIEFGRAFANKFEVELYGVQDVTGQDIVVTQLVGEEPNTEEVPLFVGVVDSAKYDDFADSRKIVAYDKMYSLGQKNVADWWNSYWASEGPKTLKSCRESLLDTFGLEYENKALINDNMSIIQTVDINNVTLLEMLKQVCELSLVMPNIGRDGILNFVELGTTAKVMTDLYEKAETSFEEYSTRIDKVNICDTDGGLMYSVGEGESVYSIRGNIFTLGRDWEELETICSTFLTTLSGISYTPAKIKMIVSDLNVSLGDKLTTDKGTHYVLSNEMSGPVLVEQSLECTGDEIVEDTANGPTIETEVANSQFEEKVSKIVVKPEIIELISEKVQVKGKFEVTDSEENILFSADPTAKEVQIAGFNVDSDRLYNSDETLVFSPVDGVMSADEKGNASVINQGSLNLHSASWKGYISASATETKSISGATIVQCGLSLHNSNADCSITPNSINVNNGTFTNGSFTNLETKTATIGDATSTYIERLKVQNYLGEARVYINNLGTVGLARAYEENGEEKTKLIVTCDTDNNVNIDGYKAVNSNNIGGYVSPLFVTDTKSASSIAVNSNNYKDGTIDVSKSGYKAIGIVGNSVTGTNAARAFLGNAYLSGNTLNYRLQNFGTSNATVTLTVYILYIKS